MIPLQNHQAILINEAFQEPDIPVDVLVWYMRALLPDDVSTVEELKKKVMQQGSIGYESLIDASEKAECPELVKILTNHNVQQLYRYVWMWSEDNSVMTRGNSWFTCKDECKKEGKRQMPYWETWDGPGAPVAYLTVESIMCQHSTPI